MFLFFLLPASNKSDCFKLNSWTGKSIKASTLYGLTYLRSVVNYPKIAVTPHAAVKIREILWLLGYYSAYFPQEWNAAAPKRQTEGMGRGGVAVFPPLKHIFEYLVVKTWPWKCPLTEQAARLAERATSTAGKQPECLRANRLWFVL